MEWRGAGKREKKGEWRGQAVGERLGGREEEGEYGEGERSEEGGTLIFQSKIVFWDPNIQLHLLLSF
jgi:hypothetical protein